MTLFVAPTVYPIVGRRLTLFLDAWTSIGAPQSGLSILEKGFALPFLHPPLSPSLF